MVLNMPFLPFSRAGLPDPRRPRQTSAMSIQRRAFAEMTIASTTRWISQASRKSGPDPGPPSVQLPPGVSYRVGDHLSVVPRNDPALVDQVARRFGFLPGDQIRLQVAAGRRAQLPVGDVVSVGRLLTEFVELQQVATRKQIQIMSEHTR